MHYEKIENNFRKITNRKSNIEVILIDVNRMCFDSEDNIEQMQVEHIKKIKKKVLKRYLIPTILILLILMVVLSLFCYSLVTRIQILIIHIRKV